MAFACQRNSYLKELVSKVATCVSVANGKFEVTLNDTVLFPEGGGQPDDHGIIGEATVSQVYRRGAEAVHVVDRALEIGSEHRCLVDWKRRFDHMQQHSGQHLLSAILDRKNIETMSWNLGESVSHVELSVGKLSAELVDAVERECNELIRSRQEFTVHYLSKLEAENLKEAKTRGLPDDVVEPIRVIEIQDIDKNMCCGTHVSNLSDVQGVKLLHTESKRGNVCLFFLCGNRIFDRLNSSLDVERKLNKLLSCGTEDFPGTVDKLKATVRLTQKSSKTFLKELGRYEALDQLDNDFIFQHREDADMDYIFAFTNTLNADENKHKTEHKVVFVAGGPIKTGGQFVLKAPCDKLAELSAPILEMIGGKGGGKKDQLQGKATSFKQLSKVRDLIASKVVKTEETASQAALNTPEEQASLQEFSNFSYWKVPLPDLPDTTDI